MSKVVLVTGGARGIGMGIAKAFVAEGHRVMIADLGGLANAVEWKYALASEDDMETSLAESSAVDTCEVDVTDALSCSRAVEATVERFGRLDVLVNNAGVVDTGPIDEFDEKSWDRIFAVNTKGIFLMTKAALPHLKASNQGAVVNTASIAGKQGSPNMAAYCGSKFAAIGITQSLALELAPHNITVNALCPGIVGTAMWLEHLMPGNQADQAKKTEDFEDRVNQIIPLGRPQSPEDMGQAVVYLASARNVTGTSLTVAGGMAN